METHVHMIVIKNGHKWEKMILAFQNLKESGNTISGCVLYVCMSVCLYIIYLYIYIYIYIYINININISMCIHIYIYISMCIHIYIYTYILRSK